MKSRILVALLALTFSGCSNAVACNYPEGFVSQPVGLPIDYKQLEWTSSTDPDSGEWVKTGRYELVTGAELIVEHKYCTIYNFEATLYPRKFKSIKSVALLLRKAYHQFSREKVLFRKPLSEIITQTWSKYSKKYPDIKEVGLPYRDIDTNQSVEFSFSYETAPRVKATLYSGIGVPD
jgi:hypothetical protein